MIKWLFSLFLHQIINKIKIHDVKVTGWFPLTQLNILVISEDEDDVGTDVTTVSLESRLQSLIGQEDGSMSHCQHTQQHQEPGHQPSCRHGHNLSPQPLTLPGRSLSLCWPRLVAPVGRQQKSDGLVFKPIWTSTFSNVSRVILLRILTFIQ